MAIPDKPIGLSHDESRLWDELVDQIPLPVLKATDGRLLRELCSVLASQRRMARINNDTFDPLVLDTYLALVEAGLVLSKRFGLTPADRAKLRIIDEPDDFVDWMEG